MTGETEGFVKIITQKDDDKMIGAHIVGSVILICSSQT